MKAMKRILSVKTRTLVDESPDTSYLGEYSSTRESERFSIDRRHALDCSVNTGGNIEEDGGCTCGESGDMGRHKYRFFNPSFNYLDENGNPADLTEAEVSAAFRNAERVNR